MSSDVYHTAANARDDLPDIDGYELIAPLGRGGMGVVYEGYQQSTGRRVAIKVLPGGLEASNAARFRFEREVELAARLQHAHIVSVLDSGMRRGRYFYAMEFIEGVSLDEFAGAQARSSRSGQDLQAALGLVAAICDAVDHAHQLGVLHRDLKPSNIMIDARGEPHILDFGLAKALDSPTRGSSAVTLSEPGQLLGTLGYMSPEQSRGQSEAITVRTDVYSLGALAYELVTGRLPCNIDGPLADVLGRITQIDPLRPSAIRRGVRADVDAILLKALDKSPERRYATAAEFAADIRRYHSSEPILARRATPAMRFARWVRRNRMVATVSAAALVLLLGLTAGFIVRLKAERDLARTARDDARSEVARFAPSIMPLVHFGHSARNRANAPDGDIFIHFARFPRRRPSNFASESPPGSPRVPAMREAFTADHVVPSSPAIGPDPPVGHFPVLA